jgi:membrane protease subunit HflC
LDVKFLGIKKLGLPESVTQKVFDRMKSERQKRQTELESQGIAEANKIKQGSDAEKSAILATANANAAAIRGQADSIAAGYYATLYQEPELAKFLLQIKALQDVGKERTTWILDTHTSPFNLLTTNLLDHSNGTNQMPSLATNSLPGLIEGKATVAKDPQ